RHTSLQGDWSSDVCSSDLPSPRVSITRQVVVDFAGVSQCRFAAVNSWKTAASRYARSISTSEFAGIELYNALAYWRSSVSYGPKIGRASCRERVRTTVVGG